MSVVAFIPARGGSERIPRKNIRELAGHPLLAYAIAGAKKAGIFDRIYVSTEDPEIMAVAIKYGAEVIKRPSKYAKGDSWDIEWLWHAVASERVGTIETLMILPPTNPFRTSYTIVRAWQQWQDGGDGHWDSLRALGDPGTHCDKQWVVCGEQCMPANILLELGAMSVDAPTTALKKHWGQGAGVRIVPYGTLIRYSNPTGSRVMPFFPTETEALDLNRELDWILAEALIERGLAKLEVVE